MFNQLEHEALLRLMRISTGYVPDSKPVAHWLQEWERSDNPRSIKARVHGLSGGIASDVRDVARAANRTGDKPSTMGRLEYSYSMENIARIYPLPALEYER